MKVLLTALIFVNAGMCYASNPVRNKTAMQRLSQFLLDEKRYDRRVKPTFDNGDSVQVSFRLDLYQILEVNEPQQSVTLNTWIEESWEVEDLFWHPEDYDGISEITLPFDAVWLPDTVLYNNLKMSDTETRRLLNVRVVALQNKRRSLVRLLYPTIYTFSCSLKIAYFPFDDQTCDLVFGSWTYAKNDIDYNPNNICVGTASYIENEGWDLMLFKGERIETKYSCCPHPYTNLNYTMKIKRKPLFYIINLIVPTAIITMISLVGFFTPSNALGERHEKITLGITTLLSMSILLLMVSDSMPTTSNYVPLIGRFYLAMIALISIGTVVSAIIIEVQKRGLRGESMSRCSMWCVRILSWLTRTRVPQQVKQVLSGKKSRDKKNGVSVTVNTNENGKRSKLAPLVSPESDVQTERLEQLVDICGPRSPRFFEEDYNAQGCFTRRSALSLPTRRQLALSIEQYEWAATVLERIALVTFLLSLGLLSIFILALGSFMQEEILPDKQCPIVKG